MPLPPPHNPPGLKLSGRRVVCFGLGRSGLAAAAFLQRHGVNALVVDEGSGPKLDEAVAQLEAMGLRGLAGLSSYEELENPDLIIVSPGVPVAHRLLQQGRARGVEVIGEVELAYRFCRAPIVAVSGTNGKGSTTTMLEQMLLAGGLRAGVGGNIGHALVNEAEGDWDVLVAEISSFQLETISLFRPWAAILLNITPDHLNRHADMDEYLSAKLRLFENQQPPDLAILNLDDPVTASLQERLPLAPLTVSLTGESASGFTRGDALLVRLPGKPEVQVATRQDLCLEGDHYVTDALCAAIVAVSAGVAPEAIGAGLRQWRPVEHQLQELPSVGSVRFVDSSKATNPTAAAADLAAVSPPVYVISGGQTKGLDMRPWAEALVRHAAAVYLIGEGAGEIAAAVAGRIPVTISETLDRAVAQAYAEAPAGATVLLAPACASFDQFSGQAQRGERFAELVRALPEREGQS